MGNDDLVCIHVVHSCLQWLTDEFIPYLNEWESSIKKRRIFSPPSKSMMLLAKETRNGINITGNLLEYPCS